MIRWSAPLGLALLLALVLLGCSGAGQPGGVDDSVTMTYGSVEVAGASGLTRVDVPSSQYSPYTFVGFYGTTVTRFAQMGKGRVCFSTQRYGSGDEIVVARPDGQSLTRITTNTAIDSYPDWSPDGTKIAFATNRDGGDMEIYTMAPDGSSPTRLTTSAGSDTYPEWSPDGKYIAFSSTRDGNNEIYRMNADGSEQTRLTVDAASDIQPTWSPDGRTIAFAAFRAGNFDVYAMSTDGTYPEPLVATADHEYDPAWSPSGTHLAYTLVDSFYNVHVVDASGANDRAVTHDGQGNATPEWSPDGRSIMYRSDGRVWVCESDGDNPQAITTGSGEGLATMSWSGSTAHVARSFIGAVGSDGGGNPPFGTSRPFVLVGMTEPAMNGTGLGAALSISLPSIHWGTVSAQGLQGTGMYLSGIQIEAARIDGVEEDLGRGVRPRYWNTSSGLITKSVVVFLSSSTGQISSIMTTTVSAAAAAEASSAPVARIEGDRLVVTGAFDAVWTAPGQNLAPGGARTVELSARTGEVLRTR